MRNKKIARKEIYKPGDILVHVDPKPWFKHKTCTVSFDDGREFIFVRFDPDGIGYPEKAKDWKPLPEAP